MEVCGQRQGTHAVTFLFPTNTLGRSLLIGVSLVDMRGPTLFSDTTSTVCTKKSVSDCFLYEGICDMTSSSSSRLLSSFLSLFFLSQSSSAPLSAPAPHRPKEFTVNYSAAFMIFQSFFIQIWLANNLTHRIPDIVSDINL